MMDVRLKTAIFEFDGKTFELCCNMNVLADVQEAYGGSINAALRATSTVKSVLTFLAAMLNDYAESAGWDAQYSARTVGRQLPPSRLDEVTRMVMGLVSDSLKADRSEPAETAGEEKN